MLWVCFVRLAEISDRLNLSELFQIPISGVSVLIFLSYQYLQQDKRTQTNRGDNHRKLCTYMVGNTLPLPN